MHGETVKLPKKISWKTPVGQRGRRRPKSGWTDGVEEGAKKLDCRNWLATAEDRDRWRHLLEEAKGCRADNDGDNDGDDDPFSME